MNPAKLARTVTGRAQHTKHFAIQCEFIDTPRITIGRIKHLMGTRRDANCPRRAIQHSLVQGRRSFCSGGHFGWGIPHPWADLVVIGHANVDLAQKLAISIENLNAPVAAIGNIHVSRIIRRDAMRCIELAWTSSRFTPGLDPVSILIDLRYPRIDVTITDIGIACRVPSHIGDLAKLPVDRWQRWLRMLERIGALVGSLLLAAEDHQYPAFRAEFDDHIRPFVGDPYVVFLVDLDGMGKAPCVEMMSDLMDVLSIGVKLEQLSRSCTIGWASRAAAREDENMPLGIDCNAGNLPEIQIRRQLKEICLSMELDFRRRLLSKQVEGEGKISPPMQDVSFIFSSDASSTVGESCPSEQNPSAGRIQRRSRNDSFQNSARSTVSERARN